MNGLKSWCVAGLLLVLGMLIAVPVSAGGGDKALRKESKKIAAELTKDGWRVFGGAQGVQEAMDRHYQRLGQSPALTSIEAYGVAADVNAAVRKCRYNASLQLAQMRELKVEGTTTMKMRETEGTQAESSMELDSEFKSQTQQTVGGLQPSVEFYRTRPDGKTEVKAFFLVDMM